MKKVLVGVGVVVGLLALVAGYVQMSANGRLTKEYTDLKVESFPIPMALAEAEVAALKQERVDAWRKAQETACAGDAACLEALAAAVPPEDIFADLDLAAIAKERAEARGKRLIETRLGCFDCHGTDYAGKVVMDVPPVMGMIAPNITPGGVVKDYTDTDWIRILRHGVGKDNQASVMPAKDYTMLSDQEIGDVVSYLRTVAPSDNVMAPAYIGPVIKAQMVFSGLQLSAEEIDHAKARSKLPPDSTAASMELGDHLHNLCTGCHNSRLSGGPIVGGDPSWPPAGNLTPDPSGLAGYSFPEFKTLMTTGVRKDGSKMQEPMLGIATNFYGKWTDAELESLHMYLMAQAPLPKGG